MSTLRNQRQGQRRIDCRFRPAVDEAGEGSAPLDRRLLLSLGQSSPAHLRGQIDHQAVRSSHHAKAGHQHQRLTPAAEINAQYDAFLAAFNHVLESYVGSISQQSTNSVGVSTTVAAPYAAGSPTIQVADASVFGAQGMFTTAVMATASVGGIVIGNIAVTGSSGNVLTLDLSKSNPSVPFNVGTVLSATVPVSAQSSASSIFPSYITGSTNLMGITLVRYFNNLPINLPRENAPPHQPAPRGAIQMYVYKSVAGVASGNSLQQLLMAIPLPTTPGSDLDIYKAAVATTVEASRLQVLAGVQEIFAGTLKISAPTPANRLGQSSNSSSSTSTTGTTSTSGTNSTNGINPTNGTSTGSVTTTSSGSSSSTG